MCIGYNETVFQNREKALGTPNLLYNIACLHKYVNTGNILFLKIMQKIMKTS